VYDYPITILNFTACTVDVPNEAETKYRGYEVDDTIAALFCNGREIWRDIKRREYVGYPGDSSDAADVVIDMFRRLLSESD
jgi:hypothetical protein